MKRQLVMLIFQNVSFVSHRQKNGRTIEMTECKAHLVFPVRSFGRHGCSNDQVLCVNIASSTRHIAVWSEEK